MADETGTGLNISGIGSSIISGGLGLLGGLFQRGFEKREAAKEREWSEAQTAKQNAWNYAMWERQNEYNSPEQQIQRMHEAGLNPLYYGLDGSSAQGLTAAQPLGYERASIAGMDNPIQQGLDAALKNAQISNIQADTAKKGNESLTEIQRREKTKQEIDQVKEIVNNLRKTGKIQDKELEQLEIAVRWADKIYEANFEKEKATAELTNWQRKRIEELLPGEKDIQTKTIEDFNRKWEQIEKQLEVYASEIGVNATTVKYYALAHMSDKLFSIKNFLLGKDDMKKAIDELKKWCEENGVDFSQYGIEEITKPKNRKNHPIEMEGSGAKPPKGGAR